MQSIAEQAEKNIQRLSKKEFRGEKKVKLSKSQIRKILSSVIRIENKVTGLTSDAQNSDALPEEIVEEIDYLKVRIAYQVGRDSGREKLVKEFVDKTDLLSWISGIQGSKKRFLQFSRYVEALVAYHRYYGGDD